MYSEQIYCYARVACDTNLKLYVLYKFKKVKLANGIWIACKYTFLKPF